MGLPFFVEEITGSGKLTTKDYMPTQVNMMPEMHQHFNQFFRSGSGGSVINWPPVSGSGSLLVFLRFKEISGKVQYRYLHKFYDLLLI
jgi:hypothetical protein